VKRLESNPWLEFVELRELIALADEDYPRLDYYAVTHS
jgi:hypothetical protein